MPRNKDKKRLEWFAFGVDALQRARPSAPQVYGCPLCIKGFATTEALTLEDVPPKSVGGRPLVLTCKTCNNTCGYVLDSHIRAGRDLQEIAEGKRDVPVRLSQFGHTISARATFGPGNVLIAGIPEKSDPKAHKALFEKLDAAVTTGSRGWNMKLEFSNRHNQRREAVGWLRVAYLYAFAALGYNFILRPELDRIREQIRKPDEAIAREVMKSTDATSDVEGISFVYEPAELRSILVRLGRNLFFFPEFNQVADFYERLERAKGVGQRLTISGIHLDLPRRPVFAFDYDQSLMIITVPPAERERRGYNV
ncbi:MAG: hypothetical protein U9P14_05030 [Gemmatimonadota bacterium]|nr:hypothetical protein [Gemmatimonadota bacterium]